MPVGFDRPLRARSALEKNRRRDEILRATERLWMDSDYASLSMHQVAREAKLAKGTLYLYFDTKEELFLALLSEKLQVWLVETHEAVTQAQPHDPRALAAVLAESIRENAQTGRLLLLLSSVMSRLPAESMRNFRHELRPYYEQLVGALPYSDRTNRLSLTHAYALSSGWRQVLDDLATLPGQTWQATEGVALGQQLTVALEAVIERLVREHEPA